MADSENLGTAESDPDFTAKLAERYRGPLGKTEAPAQITGDDDFNKLSPGSKYIGPDKKVRVKPYPVSGDTDFTMVPEGAFYIGPDKKVRQKPTYEGVGFTTEMLHDAAITPDAKREVLEKMYPGKVKEDAGGMYVDDDGVLRRPGRGGIAEGLGSAASEAAPLAGMTIGGLLGVEAGPVGMAGGGILGAMAGRQFNNTVLALAGIHQPMSDQLISTGWEGAAAASGEVIGKGLSKIPGAVESLSKGVSAVGEKAAGMKEGLHELLESLGITPERARYFLGTTPETAERGAKIANKYGGGVVDPTILAPESPMLGKIRQMDAVFRGRDVFGEAARDVYEKSGKDIIENPEIGGKVDTLTRATKSVSSKEAGELALANYQKRLAKSDAELELAHQAALTEVRRPITEAGGEAAVREQQAATKQRLVDAQAQSAKDAQDFAHAAVQDVRNDVEQTLRRAEAGQNPGKMWRIVANKFARYKAAAGQRARQLYTASDAAGGDFRISSGKLAGDAQAFLDRVPEILRSKYPEVQLLEKLAGKEAEEGKAAVPPTDLSLRELRQLRSWLRSGIDYADMTPDMREGSVRLFAGKVNDFIHGAQIPDNIKPAVAMLDRADEFYKETMPFLNDEMVSTVMQGLKAGVPPNPEELAKVLFDSDRTEALRRARSIVGPSLWKMVQAAHTNTAIKNSLTIDGRVNVGEFANKIEGLYRSGILETGYDKQTADRLMAAVKNIRQLEGNITLEADQNDTLSSLMRRAEAASEVVKREADADPLKALSKGISDVDREFNRKKTILEKQRRSEALGFLYNQSMTAKPIRAANNILRDPDLILAAANSFGMRSKEMDALRQVYVMRLFQRPLRTVAKLREEISGTDKEKGIPEEVQKILFPGVTKKEMTELVENMEFLFSGQSGDIGGSLAASSRIFDPWGHLPIPATGAVKWMRDIPGAAAIPRFMLGKFFQTVMDATSHPNFINWLAGNLAKGGLERQFAREVLQKRLNAGSLMGGQAGILLHDRNQQQADPNVRREQRRFEQ